MLKVETLCSKVDLYADGHILKADGTQLIGIALRCYTTLFEPLYTETSLRVIDLFCRSIFWTNSCRSTPRPTRRRWSGLVWPAKI